MRTVIPRQFICFVLIVIIKVCSIEAQQSQEENYRASFAVLQKVNLPIVLTLSTIKPPLQRKFSFSAESF